MTTRKRLNYFGGRPRKVDREAGVIYGYTVAETGDLRGHWGRFDLDSLNSMVRSIRLYEGGIKSHYTHPTLSSDGLSHILGRSKNPSVESITVDGREEYAILADLHFNPTALKEPVGGGRPMAEHVMELAETDPGLFASSVQVTDYREVFETDDNGAKLKDSDGNVLPPIWRDVEVCASDIVSDGAAVTSFMSEGRMLDDDYIREAVAMLDSVFGSQPLADVRTKLHAWVDRLVDWKKDPKLEILESRIKLREKALALSKDV